MPRCEKSKIYEVQKLKTAHQVSLSNGRRFEARYTKKAKEVNSLLSYICKKIQGKTKSVAHSSSWSSADPSKPY